VFRQVNAEIRLGPSKAAYQVQPQGKEARVVAIRLQIKKSFRALTLPEGAINNIAGFPL
jgi:hypothetical protein